MITWVLNHFVLIKPNSTRQHFILDIADSMEFPPLSTETAESTEERFTYNPQSYQRLNLPVDKKIE
jgi:hypothetical protein